MNAAAGPDVHAFASVHDAAGGDERPIEVRVEGAASDGLALDAVADGLSLRAILDAGVLAAARSELDFLESLDLDHSRGVYIALAGPGDVFVLTPDGTSAVACTVSHGARLEVAVRATVGSPAGALKALIGHLESPPIVGSDVLGRELAIRKVRHRSVGSELRVRRVANVELPGMPQQRLKVTLERPA